MLTVLLGVAVIGWLTHAALRWPRVTIFLTILLGQVLGQEMQLLLPESLRQPAVSGAQLRYFDPMFVGIVIATGLMLIPIFSRASRAAIACYSPLAAWMGWMLGRTGLSLTHGSAIAVLGEFRTYYAPIILTAYVALWFRTRARLGDLLWLTVGLAAMLVPVAILRGGMLHGFALGPEHRWLSAAANLALLLGVVTLAIGQARGVFRAPPLFIVALGIAFVLLTLVNGHRSVWLATAVAAGTAFLLFRPSAKQIAYASGLAAVAGAATILWLSRTGVSASDYATERLTAFTNYSADPDSYWRMFLWLQAIERIQEHPLGGPGFGEHFQLTAPSGELITTSPHNFYITVAYHSGIIGLALYLIFVVTAIAMFWRYRRLAQSGLDRAVLEVAIVSTAAVNAYFIAYPAEFSAWLYVGAGLQMCLLLRGQSVATEPTTQDTSVATIPRLASR